MVLGLNPVLVGAVTAAVVGVAAFFFFVYKHAVYTDKNKTIKKLMKNNIILHDWVKQRTDLLEEAAIKDSLDAREYESLRRTKASTGIKEISIESGQSVSIEVSAQIKKTKVVESVPLLPDRPDKREGILYTIVNSFYEFFGSSLDIRINVLERKNQEMLLKFNMLGNQMLEVKATREEFQCAVKKATDENWQLHRVAEESKKAALKV